MRVLRSKKFLVLLAVLVTAGSAVAIAIAAVTSQQVITDTTNMHLRVQRTIADGFDSGWHVHPGLAIVQVEEGSLQIYENGCTPKTVGAGDTFIEVPFQPVRGIATGHVVWTTSFVVDNAGLFTIPLSSYSPGRNPCPSLP
jgi:quercetin dioxygenase-like cupin family protein